MWSHGRIIHLPQFKPKPPANKRVCPLRLAVPVRAHVPPIHAHSTQTFSRVAGNMDMPEKSKLDFLKIVGEYHMRVREGLEVSREGARGGLERGRACENGSPLKALCEFVHISRSRRENSP